jgi:hypothetical protein
MEKFKTRVTQESVSNLIKRITAKDEEDLCPLYQRGLVCGNR